MKNSMAVLLTFAAFATVKIHAQKFTGLAMSPPMGWNSWNKFAGNINEVLISQAAGAMSTNGMFVRRKSAVFVGHICHEAQNAMAQKLGNNVFLTYQEYDGDWLRALAQ